jgi:hypothetical protein
MKTKMTHAERDRGIFAQNTSLIYDLGIVTPEQMFELKGVYGGKFASHYVDHCLAGSKKAKTFLTQTPPKEGEKHNFFWAWWLHQWQLDDADYLQEVKAFLNRCISGKSSFERMKMPSYIRNKEYMWSNDLLINGFDMLYGREILAEVSKVDSPQLVSSI